MNGKVVQIRVDTPNGQAKVYFDKPIGSTPPSCVHSSYTSVLAIDATTDGSKPVLSVALTAKTTQSNVVAYGKSRYGVYGESLTEMLDNMILK